MAERTVAASQIDRLLAEAESTRRPERAEPDGPEPATSPFEWHELADDRLTAGPANFDLAGDVELDLRIELGRTRMVLEDVLKLRRGTVVPLDKLVGEAVDIIAGGQLIARGEVIVLNGNFAARIIELVLPSQLQAGGTTPV